MSVIGVFVVFAAIATAFSTIWSWPEPDKDGRDRDSINTAAQMLEDEPFGVGWNNYAVANSRPVPTYSQMLEQWSRNRGHHVKLEDYEANPLTESLYWCILAETGYLGFITYALFLILTFWWCWRNIPCQRDNLMGFFLFGLGITLFVNYGHSHLERILT